MTSTTGVRVVYYEAGDPSKRTILLLHGFPSSSIQFHDFMPRLPASERWRRPGKR
jgi:pimeloyl-ACP methyl ester carboxylesterase